MTDFLVSFDHSLFWLINSHHNVALDVLFGVLTNLGSGWVAGPLCAVIAVWKAPRRRLAWVLILGTVAMSLSGTVNSQVKHVVKRSRPVQVFARAADGTGTPAVHVVGKPLRFHSFPSGHTNTAFAASTLLIIVFGRWAWLSLLLAAAVGYSRVYVGAHFPLDTMGGAFLGVLVTSAITAPGMWWVGRREPREAPVQGQIRGEQT